MPGRKEEKREKKKDKRVNGEESLVQIADLLLSCQSIIVLHNNDVLINTAAYRKSLKPSLVLLKCCSSSVMGSEQPPYHIVGAVTSGPLLLCI